MNAAGLEGGPRITVLMPVYNGAAYLDAAIDSILGQTCTDFELLVVDDGSTDDSVAWIQAHSDGRIRLLRQSQNMGLVAALNRGIDEARGEYIARMDADDISLPQRLEKQMTFLDAHPEVGVCGSWMEAFSSTEISVWKAPVDHDEISCRLLFESVLYHPTVMMRRGMIECHGLRYDANYPHAEDYEFWCRCARLFDLANLDQVLLRYRVHKESVGGRKRAEKLATAGRVRVSQLGKLGVSPSAGEMVIHNALALWEMPAESGFLDRVQSWLLRLQTTNRERKIFSIPLFDALLAERWYHACEQASSLGLTAWRAWTKSSFRALHTIPWSRRLVFWAKCWMRY